MTFSAAPLSTPPLDRGPSVIGLLPVELDDVERPEAVRPLFVRVVASDGVRLTLLVPEPLAIGERIGVRRPRAGGYDVLTAIARGCRRTIDRLYEVGIELQQVAPRLIPA